MAEDMYTIGVRTFHATMEAKAPIRTLFRDRYFPNVIESSDTKVRIETRRKSNVVLPSIRRGSNALELTQAAPHMVEIVEPPFHFYRASVGIDDTNKRVFGEPVNNPYSPAERARVILAEKLYEGARDSMALMQEAYTSQLIKTGKVTLKTMDNKGSIVTYGEVAFDVNSNLVGKNLSGGAGEWTSDSDIPAQISDMALAVFEESGIMPSEVVLGASAFATLRSNSIIKDVLDVRRIEGSQMENVPFAQYPGAAIAGYLNIPYVGRVTLITYANTYSYIGGSATKMIDDKYVLVTHPGWGSMGYGALYDASPGGFPNMVPGKSLIHVKPGDIENGFMYSGYVQSAPLPIPTQLDAWGYFKVV